MYLKHFGLAELPFSITPDTSFYFASSSYQNALNTLIFAINTGEGFIKITGEVGTGKTLLCRKLMSSLDDSFKVAYIPNPYLEPQSLLLALAEELDVTLLPEAQTTQHILLNALTHALLDFARNNMKVVICLDEVQAMPIETLEALRLLSNLETEKRKLLQVVIFGQPELEDKLNHPSIRQLKQRITFDYQLDQLSRDELSYYINHRLIIAGYKGSRIFTPAALYWLYRYSKGVPRLVNILANKAMLASYGKGKHQVSYREILAAARDTKSVNIKAGNLWSGKFLLPLILCVSALFWVIYVNNAGFY
ncbi:MAG: AAA family ATPase [Betaproteobacteria bacterium HGW-Betaproteobacteria-22]|nr:MAG: AAA family ATPase [Betaproteobacteria bacterium HGW-Betaproteobacteria-22]